MLSFSWDLFHEECGRRYQGELWSDGGVGASTFSDTIDSLWFKDEVSDAFLPSNLLVRSHTALGLILLKSVNVCCTCSWAKPDYYN